MSRPDIFLSYNREDAARAKLFADAFVAEGFDVWWDANLRSGEEYDRVTEAALRDASAVVVLWSKRSVDSSWVRAEATQAYRSKKLMPAMIEDCIRPVMFELTQTAELSHWTGDRVDTAWRAFIADLHGFVGKDAMLDREAVHPANAPKPRGTVLGGKKVMAAAGGLLAVLLAIGAWWWQRPTPAVEHSMMVRLAGFQLLSEDLPNTIGATVDAEIAAAFNADGVIGISTASASAPGSAPAYALGGTLQRNGDTIRVITNLTNERSGATLWSGTFDYDGKEVARIPRRIAVDTGNVVRCGLFGASTYRKALPDPVLRDYLQFCQGHWDTNLADGRRALLPAQRVVAAVPDFSWGWAAVAGGYWKVASSAGDARLAEEARASGREAADRAVAIDSRNSEALYIKAVLTEQNDWIGKEGLYKRALAALRLDCGCERHQYGMMLANVGRLNEAVEQLQQANDMLALYLYTPLSLADALIVAGRLQEAVPVYDAALDLAPNVGFAVWIATYKATVTRDIAALAGPELALSDELRSALLAGYRAVESGDAKAKSRAIAGLLALPQDQQQSTVVWLLADLGASHDALRIASRVAAQEYPGPSVLWHPSMRGVMREPGFQALVEQFGLMKYWKESNTRPDACNEANPAPFCSRI